MTTDIKFETVNMKLSSGKIKEQKARELILSNESQGWELVAAMPIVSGLLFKRERLLMIFRKG
jgi:hypothetical protein